MNVQQVFLSRCCKNSSGYCVYIHVARVCFKCFRCFIRLLQVFYLDIAYDVCNCFKCFSSVFTNILDTYLKCFICLLLYVAIVASWCFKSILGVAHGMRVRSGQWRGGRPEQHSPLLGHSLASTTRWGARWLTEQVPSDASASDRTLMLSPCKSFFPSRFLVLPYPERTCLFFPNLSR
jgi:hypothetical protein